MPLNKTLYLYYSLVAKEQKELDLVMKSNKKKSLQNLHNIVKSPSKSKKIKDKADLFKLIFGLCYSKKKDYLLRNEIRLYNQKLKKILSYAHFKQNDELQQQALINELEKRNLDEALAFELNKKILEEERKYNYYNLMSLYEKQFKLKRKKLPFLSDKYKELKELMHTELEIKLNFIGESVSKTALNLAYIERVWFQLTQQKNYTKIVENKKLFANAFKTDIAYLNTLKAKAFSVDGLEKIKLLEQMLGFLQTTEHPNIDKQREIVFSQQALALECMFLGEYDKAISYFELCFEQKENMKKNFFLSVSTNYLSTLTKARYFNKASQFILENDLHLSERLSKRMLPVMTITLVLSNNIEAAEKLMPLKFDKNDLDYYHYLRILHCIILFENKLYELAHNEALNLKKHLKNFTELSNDLDNVISNFVISFIRIEYQYIGVQKIEKRNKLKEDLMRFTKQNNDFDSDNLIIIWLKRKLLIE